MAKSVYEMSDDEIMAINDVDSLTEPEKKEEDTSTGSNEDTQPQEQDTPIQTTEPENNTPSGSENDANTSNSEENQDTQVADENNSDTLENNEGTSIDYKGFYNQVMTPFKANGKTITLQNSQEAIQLMQMGANYTRKMQELAPYRKQMRMLEKANIDENTLSLLIDVNSGNQEAIKKLLKDKSVDAYSLESSEGEESSYVPGSNLVTDEEVNLNDVISEVRELPKGNDFLDKDVMNWDDQSKNRVYQQPGILKELAKAKDLGVYDAICQEIDRQRMIGTIMPNTSFLDAYQIAGDSLMARYSNQPPQQQPIIRQGRVANTLGNDARVRAASQTRTSSTNAKKFINPFAGTDEEFLERFKDRL